ncbi:MAG: TetR/AcrR family transcriptional regulator [Asticcacaulis sp.]
MSTQDNSVVDLVVGVEGDATEALTARAKSKLATRKKVMDSARDLFITRGFEAATIRDIASGAGLSTGAVFANFRDKTDLFLAVLEAEADQVGAAVVEADLNSGSVFERIDSQLRAAVAYGYPRRSLLLAAFVIDANSQDARISDLQKISAAFNRAVRSVLDQALEVGELRSGVDTAVAAEMIEMIGFNNLRLAALDNPAEKYVLSRTSAQIRMLLQGLASDQKLAA